MTIRNWDDSSNAAATASAFVSVGNSTTTPLAGDETFTGVGEDVSGFASIAIVCETDVPSASSGFTLEFSLNGTNWGRAKTYTFRSGDGNQTHTLGVASKFFRVVYTNGSDAQSHFRLSVKYNKAANFGLVSGARQQLKPHDDVTLVRDTALGFLDLAAGNLSYASQIRKFGRNPDIDTGQTEFIWDAGGSYTGFIQAARTVRIAAGGNSNDTAAGTGAQSVTISGIGPDSDGVLSFVSETLATAGASASSYTTQTFWRVYRAQAIASGTYGGLNVGPMVIQDSAANTMAHIGTGRGTTTLGFMSVPEGKTGYVTNILLLGSAQSGKDATFTGYIRKNFDDVTTPFQSPTQFGIWSEVVGTNVVPLHAPVVIPEKSDIWFTATATSNNTPCAVEFDMTFVDNYP